MIKTEISVVIDIKGLGETKLSMQDAKKLYDQLSDLFKEKVVYQDNWWYWKPYIQPYLAPQNPWVYPYITWCNNDSITSAKYEISV